MCLCFFSVILNFNALAMLRQRFQKDHVEFCKILMTVKFNLFFGTLHFYLSFAFLYRNVPIGLDKSANSGRPELCFTFRIKGGSRILARGVHMSDGNAQETESLYVRQCIIHAFKRVRAVV